MATPTDNLNRWASEYMGETGEDVEHAVDSRWWTGSPATAFALLMKLVNSGVKLELDIMDGRVTVELGEEPKEISVEGPARQLGRLLVEAAYTYVNADKETE